MKLNKPFTIFFLLFIAFISCGSPNEGCTDSNAANFDVSAENDCCCIYPNFNISIQLNNGENFLKTYSSENSVGDTLIDEVGNRFYIEKLSIYVSDFRFSYKDEPPQFSSKRIFIFPKDKNGKDSTLIIDDFGLYQTSIIPFSSSKLEIKDLFTINSQFKMNKFQFLVGVKDSAQVNRLVSIRNASHPLAFKKDTVYNYDNELYNSLILKVKGVDSNLLDRVFILSKLDQRVNITLESIDYQHIPGFNRELKLRLFANELVKNINFEDTKENIEKKLTQNLSNSFSF